MDVIGVHFTLSAANFTSTKLESDYNNSEVMDIFRTLGSRSLTVTAMLNFSGEANTSIDGLGEDDTAIIFQDFV